ncbi:MAG: hypothetical protein ABSB22_24560 [Thermodesulfobacteriota bacterium]
MLEDNIRTFGDHGQGRAGLLAAQPAGASVDHQAGLLVHLLWVAEVLSAAFVAVAMESFTEGTTAKLKRNKRSKEVPMWPCEVISWGTRS